MEIYLLSPYMHYLPSKEMFSMAEFMVWCTCHGDSSSKGVCLVYSKLLDAYTCVWPVTVSITYTNSSHRHFIAKFVALYVGDCISTYKIFILHGLLSVIQTNTIWHTSRQHAWDTWYLQRIYFVHHTAQYKPKQQDTGNITVFMKIFVLVCVKS
jgi:hypothetical protein